MTATRVQINKNFERKMVHIFLSIRFNIHFGCSKEPSQYFEYPKGVFWFRNEKKLFNYMYPYLEVDMTHIPINTQIMKYFFCLLHDVHSRSLTYPYRLTA